MKREFSAGGIVFNDGKVLIIQNVSMKDPEKKYWGFPKGRLEEGEKSIEAAIREVEEETGIKAEISQKVGDSKYVFPFEGEKIFKVVSIFLMNYLSGEIKIQQEELDDAKWVSPEKALELLSFSNDRVLLKKAMEIQNGE